MATIERRSDEDRKVRSLQRSLRRLPHREATLRAQILTIELGGAHAPAAAAAWQRVREVERALVADP
jgi:hypothetical protein